MRLGVDIGGTFTDLVLSDTNGIVATKKVLTNNADPVAAIVEAISAAVQDSGASAAAIAETVHGTTLVTNAVIEGKAARTALVTSKGFGDVLEIGREWRYDIYDIMLDPPPVTVPRSLRFDVGERVKANGEVLQPLDEAGLRRVAAAVPKDVKAIAVCFLHSYRSPDHERRAQQILQEELPGVAISISSDIAPEIREFERMSTTIVNASVQPLVKPYLTSMDQRLKEAGVDSNLYIFLSNGGLITAADASRYPVRIVESGPAAGVVGAALVARMLGEEHVVALDMGGTTAKICFVDKGMPQVSSSLEVARSYRFKPGSGIPLKIPSLELLEIGAGGGSIARVNSLGLMQVGPESAGSSPGPACYAVGGAKPTVTDADLVLGYFNAGYFLGGAIQLDAEGARRAIRADVAKPLDLGLEQAAWGIHRLVNENMANALRIHAAERGKDASRYALLASGGAAGVHAAHIAEAVNIDKVICPGNASVFSAVGMLTAPVSFDFVRTARYDLASVDWDDVGAFVAEMKEIGSGMLVAAGIGRSDISYRISCDLRFIGQGFEIEVPLRTDTVSPAMAAELEATFGALYRERYGRMPAHVGIEVLNWRLRVLGPEPQVTFKSRDAEKGQPPLKDRRGTYFAGSGWVDTAVYERSALYPGASFQGPAVVEETDTTVLVPASWRAIVDSRLNIVLERVR